MSKLRLVCMGLLSFQESVIDNFLFRLQYRLTMLILLFLSLVVALRQFFGSQMHCMTRDFHDYVNDYCSVHPTYSVVEAWNNASALGPYPGVTRFKNGTRVYHYYYQWVASVLFLQSVLFVIPWYFWRTMEAGRVRESLKDFKKSTDPSKVQILASEVNSPFHNWSYFAYFVATEITNVVNVIGQIFLMDSFLGGAFLAYGSEVLNQPRGTPENPFDPMLRVFPRVTKCDYKQYGVSGATQMQTVQCSLALNILYEKIYLFLWFWFAILAVLSSLALGYGLVLLVPQVRGKVLMLQTRSDAKTALYVTKKLNIGNWFFLYLVNKNLKLSWRKELMLGLSDNTEKSDSQELEYVKL